MDIRQVFRGSFLTKSDVAEGPRREVIVTVEMGKYDKPDLHLESGDRLSLNATNAKTLMRAYGADTDGWTGKEIELQLGTIEYQGRDQDAVLVAPISPPVAKSEPAFTPKPKVDDPISTGRPREFDDGSDSDLPF